MPRNATESEGVLNAKQQAALAALLEGTTITDAAQSAGIDRTTLHRWLRDDLEFRAARNRGLRLLEESVMARLVPLADRALGVVEEQVGERDLQVALAVLKGVGVLAGTSIRIGSGSAETLRQADFAAEVLGQR